MWRTLKRCISGLVALLALAAGALDAAPAQPEHLIAEATPNDKGTHISLRWPVAEAEEADTEYVILIRRGPDLLWIECARVAADAGFVTDPGIEPFYPYRFRKGDEHYAIIEPAACIPLYWLHAEKRCAEWLRGANGALQDCEQNLLALDRNVRELGRLGGRLRYYSPRWQTELREQKERYIRRAGLPTSPEELDVLDLWAELTEQKQQLLEKRDGAAALTSAEQDRLRDINDKLKSLRGARRYARYLAESASRAQGLADGIAALKSSCLEAIAKFSCIYALVQGESRIHLAAALELDPEQVTAQAVRAMTPSLEKRLAATEAAAESAGGVAAAYDAFDQARYVCHLARAYVERAENGISVREIENDLLWQLSRGLEEAGLLAEPEPQEAAPPQLDPLLAALAAERRTGLRLDADLSGGAHEEWAAVQESLEEARGNWEDAKAAELEARLRGGFVREPDEAYARWEKTGLTVLVKAAEERAEKVAHEHSARRYYVRLAAVSKGEEPGEGVGRVSSAMPEPALFDGAKLANLAFAVFFGGAVLGMIVYVRRKPDVFLRHIAGLEAVDEAIGRATEMGKPILFVHGLSDLSSMSVLASISILGRMARRIAEYDSDLLVVNNKPMVYSVSYEVVQEGYTEAGRPDAFKPDNVFMAASEQFPYVTAVAGIMKRRQPAANFFMGSFWAESLILAEVGSSTGAIQIAATDKVIQIPFFITTCDYTLIGEELFAAGAYLSRNARMLATIKAQDLGKAVLLAALPAGLALSNFGQNWLNVIFTAYEKGF